MDAGICTRQNSRAELGKIDLGIGDIRRPSRAAAARYQLFQRCPRAAQCRSLKGVVQDFASSAVDGVLQR